MKIKVINLYPSEFKLDVIISKTASEELTVYARNRYGMPDTSKPLHPDECALFYTGHDSPLNGEKRFVICLSELSDRIIFHEIVHLMWQYCEETGSEMSTNTQEWQAIMFERVFVEIQDIKGYKKIK